MPNINVYTINEVEDKIATKFKVLKKDSLPFSCRGTRSDLAKLFCELGYFKGAEIGVYMGHYSMELCQANPDLELLCVDPWKDFGSGRSGRDMEGKLEYCKMLNSKFKITYKRMTSKEAVKDIPDGSLDFVYIDALHDFNNAMMDMILWDSKVRIGGIVAGHDYWDEYQMGVIQAVISYTQANVIWPYYVTQADRSSHCPSWFWVKKR